MNKRHAFQILDPASNSRGAKIFRVAQRAIISLGLLLLVGGTTPRIVESFGGVVSVLWWGLIAYFALEYGVRLYLADQAPGSASANAGSARVRWAASRTGVVDLLALAPLAALVVGADAATAHLFGVLWSLKYVRYSRGMAILARVLPTAGSSLLSVLVAFTIVLLMAATLAHVFEGEAQPDAYGSIPAALWWTIVTLTTTGYGDVTPQTVAGRVLAGVVMISGIAVFALWAGILATSFADEMRRHNFLRTWDLVAKVPLFRNIGAALIADVARLLRPRDVPAGATIMRVGDPGDCMYFIVSGEVEVQMENRRVLLAGGDFFGEIALVSSGPRTATLVATVPCKLLVLDVSDFRDLAGRHPELIHLIEVEAARRSGDAGFAGAAKG